MSTMPGQPAPEQPGSNTSGLQEARSQVNEAIGRLTGPGEPLIALGAVLLLFVDLFGDLIFRDYAIAYLTWLAAVLIVLAIGLHRFARAPLPVTYGTLLATLALIGGLVMARQLIGDLRSDSLQGGARVFFALVAYTGGVMALIGSWQMWRSNARQP